MNGRQMTENVRSFSNNGVNHSQKNDDINHRTHPDRLQHKQADAFERGDLKWKQD